MIHRQLHKLIQSRLEHYPAVGLLGPRQCGKTTLAKAMGGVYFDLEVEADRVKLDAQWPDIIHSPQRIILDEAQTMPQIFPRLRSAIDQDRKRMGRFVLLGSVSPTLMRNVSESLAGRLALAELTPFLLGELPDTPVDTLWLRGGYPDGGVLDAARYPRWQNDYLSILVQRDLPEWGLPAQPSVTERLLKMIAAVHGQHWNASRIGQSLGLNYQTVNSYLNYIQGCFMIRLLQSYSSNVSKRLRKSPKIYWRDSGLLHALMQVSDMDDLFAQPWVGASWEGFVIEQIISALKTADKLFTPYYFRTADQHEIDLVLDCGRKVIAIEVKLTSAPDTDDVARLKKAAQLIGATQSILVSRTDSPVFTDLFVSCDLPRTIRHLLDTL